MNKKELKELIDTEVSKVFSDITSKEPEKELEKELEREPEKNVRETPKVESVPKTKSLTEEELDDLWFGGQKKK